MHEKVSLQVIFHFVSIMENYMYLFSTLNLLVKRVV